MTFFPIPLHFTFSAVQHKHLHTVSMQRGKTFPRGKKMWGKNVKKLFLCQYCAFSLPHFRALFFLSFLTLMGCKFSILFRRRRWWTNLPLNFSFASFYLFAFIMFLRRAFPLLACANNFSFFEAFASISGEVHTIFRALFFHFDGKHSSNARK